MYIVCQPEKWKFRSRLGRKGCAFPLTRCGVASELNSAENPNPAAQLQARSNPARGAERRRILFLGNSHNSRLEKEK